MDIIDPVRLTAEFIHELERRLRLVLREAEK